MSFKYVVSGGEPMTNIQMTREQENEPHSLNHRECWYYLVHKVLGGKFDLLQIHTHLVTIN